MEKPDILIRNTWETLKQFTAARIALGRTGASIPTNEYLQFKLSHAQAKDAVWQPFDNESIAEELQSMGIDTVQVESMAGSKEEYLRRPDLGRKLSTQSTSLLTGMPVSPANILIVVGDGLSSKAVHEHAVPFIWHFLPYVHDFGKTLHPVVIAKSARVALGDEIGQLLNAQIIVMLIGERPGLSSADSLGIYLTWQPRAGKSDAERNCISNVRPQGMIYPKAAFKLAWLIEHAFEQSGTGVQLKDMSDSSSYHRTIKPHYVINC